MKLRHTLALGLVLGCYQHHEIGPERADSGSADAGRADSGLVDVGRVDSGGRDAGPVDGCGVVPATFLAPRVLFDDQPFATTLFYEETADCGCRLDLQVVDRAVDLRLCDCGDACDAALTLYSGSHVFDARGESPITYRLGGTSHQLDVISVDPRPTPGGGCRPMEATRMELVQTTGNHVGPRLVWAGLTGQQSLCCSPELRLAARTLPGDRRAIELQLFSCTIEDCICGPLPPPTVATAWHNIGELAPGDYTVRAGGLLETITVF